MDFLDRFLGPDVSTGMRFLIAFAVVFVLILLVVWALKRVSRGLSAGEKRGRAPRLAVLEATAVDQRRRLVLVRRDNIEHLLLIGGPSDLVIEPGIQRVPRVVQRPVEPQMEPATRSSAPAAPTPVARPEPRLAPAPVPQPRDPATPRPAPHMAPQMQTSGVDDDGAQRQLAEMAERLELALRAPAAAGPVPPSTAGSHSELRTSAGDRIGVETDGHAAAEADLAAPAQDNRRPGSLFGRLSRRQSE